jgi:hypothetical protein
MFERLRRKHQNDEAKFREHFELELSLKRYESQFHDAAWQLELKRNPKEYIR